MRSPLLLYNDAKRIQQENSTFKFLIFVGLFFGFAVLHYSTTYTPGAREVVVGVTENALSWESLLHSYFSFCSMPRQMKLGAPYRGPEDPKLPEDSCRSLSNPMCTTVCLDRVQQAATGRSVEEPAICYHTNLEGGVNFECWDTSKMRCWDPSGGCHVWDGFSEWDMLFHHDVHSLDHVGPLESQYEGSSSTMPLVHFRSPGKHVDMIIFGWGQIRSSSEICTELSERSNVYNILLSIPRDHAVVLAGHSEGGIWAACAYKAMVDQLLPHPKRLIASGSMLMDPLFAESFPMDGNSLFLSTAVYTELQDLGNRVLADVWAINLSDGGQTLPQYGFTCTSQMMSGEVQCLNPQPAIDIASSLALAETWERTTQMIIKETHEFRNYRACFNACTPMFSQNQWNFAPNLAPYTKVFPDQEIPQGVRRAQGAAGLPQGEAGSSSQAGTSSGGAASSSQAGPSSGSTPQLSARQMGGAIQREQREPTQTRSGTPPVGDDIWTVHEDQPPQIQQAQVQDPVFRSASQPQAQNPQPMQVDPSPHQPMPPTSYSQASLHQTGPSTQQSMLTAPSRGRIWSPAYGIPHPAMVANRAGRPQALNIQGAPRAAQASPGPVLNPNAASFNPQGSTSQMQLPPQHTTYQIYSPPLVPQIQNHPPMPQNLQMPQIPLPQQPGTRQQRQQAQGSQPYPRPRAPSPQQYVNHPNPPPGAPPPRSWRPVQQGQMPHQAAVPIPAMLAHLYQGSRPVAMWYPNAPQNPRPVPPPPHGARPVQQGAMRPHIAPGGWDTNTVEAASNLLFMSNSPAGSPHPSSGSPQPQAGGSSQNQPSASDPSGGKTQVEESSN